MKELFHKVCQKFLAGTYSIKLKKDLYVSFPRLAPVFTAAIGLTTLGEIIKNNPLAIAGYVSIAICFFGFFYYNIFPDRKPKA